MAKTLNKAKDNLAKFISEKGGKTTEGKNTDTAKEDNSTVNPIDDEISKINDMMGKMIDAANTIVENVAETVTEAMGEVVEVKSIGNVATKADVKSVVEIAKGIKKIVEAAGIADKLKAEADKSTKPISEESNNKEAGKMFSGKQVIKVVEFSMKSFHLRLEEELIHLILKRLLKLLKVLVESRY